MKNSRTNNKAIKARALAVSEACADEIARFNAAIANGSVVTITVATYPQPLAVAYCTADFRIFTPKANGGFGFHWHIANDGRWAEMLRMAGVRRHGMFAAHAA